MSDTQQIVEKSFDQNARKHRVGSDILPSPSHAYVISVCGGTSSGKTWLTQILQKYFSDYVMIIPQDAFYKSGDASTNFDHPDAIEFELLVDCVRRAKAGESVDIPVYDFTTHRRTENTLHLVAKPIVIVEGILIMTDEELMSLCDLRVYVHAELDTMYRRRSSRDKAERGRTQEMIDEQWNTQVKPMHKEFVVPSERKAHISINNDQDQILTNPRDIPQINIMLVYIDSYLSQLSSASDEE
jgi:uridine kinase